MSEAENTFRHPESRSLKIVKQLDAAGTILETGAAIVSGLLLLVIMALISVDALGRYAFNSPLSFAYEIITMYLMPAGLLLCISFTLRRGGHVNVEIFETVFPRRMFFGLSAAVMLISVPFVWAIAYRNAAHLLASYQANEITTGVHPWPIWLTYLPASVGMLLLTFRILLLAVGCALAAGTGRTAYATAVGDYDHLHISEQSI